MMGRLQVILLLALTGFILTLGADLFRNYYPKGMDDRACPNPAAPTAVAPEAVAVDEGAGSSPQARSTPPPPLAFRPGTGGPSRLPFRIRELVNHHNLVMVVNKYARQYGVDEDLVWAVIRQESGFNPAALSPKGAMGLMQLMPGTAAQMGVSDAFDVEQNIAGGIKYLDYCLNQFNRNVPLALAAYNAGPENVVKYQGCPPFPETRNYVANILQAYANESFWQDEGLRSLTSQMPENLPDSARPGGLIWKIPLPKWRVTAPQFNVGSPHWKMTLRPF